MVRIAVVGRWRRPKSGTLVPSRAKSSDCTKGMVDHLQDRFVDDTDLFSILVFFCYFLALGHTFCIAFAKNQNSRHPREATRPSIINLTQNGRSGGEPAVSG
jgi:hypothetical protein